VADTDKNIYSLVLSDDVIDEIDSMARSAGLSRSAMVNQILAEKTRCITPEMRVKQITNAIREAVGGEFYLAQQPSPATVACRTALKYRYKPTLRYSVELFAVARKRTGELKVSVRSQSGQLNDDLTGFFQCWVKLEQKYYRTHSGWVGGLKETKYRLLMQEKPEVAVRVAVRGMMPRNIVTKDSLKRLHIYAGEQHEHQAQKPELVK